MIERRKSKAIRIGGVTVGGGAPVAVQSMCSTKTAGAKATLAQIEELATLGCEIIRVAVPDVEATEALPQIVRHSPIPVVADIHFDHRLALAALAAGVHGLRLNPGNIRDPEKIREVVREAKARETPIRIGVNAGSLPPLPPTPEGEAPPPLHERMVDAALWEIRILEEMGFELIKVSLKAFDVPAMVAANRELSKRMPYPLHLGVTEAGTPRAGAVRSAVGLGILLSEGIGDTIRVSLTADPREELPVAWDILKAAGVRERGPTIVSCPTCGRTEIDLLPLALRVEDHFSKLGHPLTIAVMGCIVNGPGEAKMADIGLAGGKGRGVIFRKGEVVRTVDEAQLFDALVAEAGAFLAENDSDNPASTPSAHPEALEGRAGNHDPA